MKIIQPRNPNNCSTRTWKKALVEHSKYTETNIIVSKLWFHYYGLVGSVLAYYAWDLGYNARSGIYLKLNVIWTKSADFWQKVSQKSVVWSQLLSVCQASIFNWAKQKKISLLILSRFLEKSCSKICRLESTLIWMFHRSSVVRN